MTGKKISDLPAAVALTGAEPVESIQGGNSVQTTASAIATLFSLNNPNTFFTLTMQRVALLSPHPGGTFASWGDDAQQYGTAGGNGGGSHIGITPTLNNASGYYGALIYQMNTSLKARFNAGMSQTTNIRMWVGFCNATGGTMGGSDTPATSICAFRYSTTAGDTHWQCVTSDGASITTVDSGIAPDLSKNHLFGIETDETGLTVTFYIDGVAVGTIITHLPANATNLRYVLNITPVTLVGAQGLFGDSVICSDSI